MKNTVVKMSSLANVIYPDSLCLDEMLYFRAFGNSWYSYDDRVLYLKADSRINFDTYFNSFSVGKWRYYTDIGSLFLQLKIKGHVLLYIYHMSSAHIQKTVSIHEIKQEESEEVLIQIPGAIKDGIVHFAIKAIEDSEVESISWKTDKTSSNRVKLGISITTFKREEAVVKSSQRIREFLEDADIDAHLLVVDNGKSVKNIQSDDRVTYIENENLGGSGGFARGLYHLKNEGGFTHALFMDDDASCENESVYRTYCFLSYAKDPKLAIAGSMLFGHDPHIQWESGANFNEHCRPQKSYFNMHDLHHICDNEDNQRFDYGGWWFFAFPIEDSKYPFPFFVRGDDVNFGLQKRFSQTTLNGIATWGDDFSYKESPMTLYLDTRAHMMNHFQVKYLSCSYMTLIKIFWKPFLKYLLIYRYASSHAVLDGVKDALKGPKFWEENIGMKEIFPKLAPLVAEERLQKEHFLENSEKFVPLQEEPLSQRHLLMKSLKALTLNGHLVPPMFFKRNGVSVDKRDHRFGVYFLRREVFVVNPAEQEGVVLRHDKKRFFTLLKEGVMLSIALLKKRKALENSYRDAYDYLTSQAYWEKQFFNADQISKQS